MEIKREIEILLGLIIIILLIWFVYDCQHIGISVKEDCKINDVEANKDADIIIKSEISNYKRICLPCGFYFYDWPGRPLGVCIPVLDNKGRLIQCEEK